MTERRRWWGLTWSIAVTLLLVLSAVPGLEAQTKAAAKLADLNNATQAELEKLPGVGQATAKKIIAGRSYAAGTDVAKALEGAGVTKSTITKITPLVTIGAAPPGATAGSSTPAPGSSPTPSTSAGAPTPAPKPGATAKATPARPTQATAQAQTPPEKGMVWANTESKIYHKEGSRWYGKTKAGKWMAEADAVKEGYRAAKNE